MYEKNLLSLFEMCPRCLSPAYGVVSHVFGSLITVEQDCGMCRFHQRWTSQPMIGSIPAGNLLLSCAILFSGSMPTKSLRLFDILNVSSISKSTFMKHQRHYLQPAIIELWNQSQAAFIDEAVTQNRALCIGGDGRSDSPGHCAKYGSYTVMDLDQNTIVDVQLVQVS